MKKLIAGLILVTALGGASASFAHSTHKASQYCADHDDQPAFGTTSPTASEVNQKTDNGDAFVDVDGHGAAVCLEGPVKGYVGAQHAGGNQGWVVIDGDADNPGPAGGFLAVQVGDNTDRVGVVASCGGNYDDDAALEQPSLGDPTSPDCQP